MHKTLYIDIDEEITSVIDRLKRVVAREIIIVVPKSAILLQSVVNLKLLKKEADRQKKQLLIITQDKIGKKLIEKAGILTQTKAEKDLFTDGELVENLYEPMYVEEASSIREELRREKQQKEMGTSEYFDEPILQKLEVNDEKSATILNQKPKKEKTVLPITSSPKFAKDKSVSDSKKRTTETRFQVSDIVISRLPLKKKKTSQCPVKKKPDTNLVSHSFPQVSIQAKPEPIKVNQVSIKKAEKFFRGSRRIKKDFEVTRVSGGIKKYFVFFGGLSILFAMATTAYFLLHNFPKATVNLYLKNQKKAVFFDFTASAMNDEFGVIEANLEQIERETTESFDVTGSKNGGSKATGKVVIYNEFSSEEQPLVATTRLETSDGKIFRITKNVVVPGITKIGNEVKPGAIEVDVVADQPGEAYNIGPSDFKIPGFRNMPEKYEKFYAKSAKAMSGGLSGTTKVIINQDIAAAKEKITTDGKKAAVEELNKNLPPGRKIFDDAIQFEVLNISFSDNAGTEKDKFSSTVRIRVSALSFQEADVEKIMKDNLIQSGMEAKDISFEKPFNYILTESNIQQKKLKFRAETDVKISSEIDIENFRRGILGKSIEEAQAYAKSFPSIEKMDISLWPFFANKIPISEKRIKIEVK